ncbi:hypothetical protein C8F04DRAFT_465535 [Mycena alexandri]|uniref:NAD(P)-binding protein n=1 Tax=Mycena alexandri TaxID=1745969 RepID=A0AAD6X2Q8_9AGAR|nr:hypothetical protein C8F04DRAFT_465535 [Mycena alexandri]
MPRAPSYLLLALALVPILTFLRTRRPKRSSKLPRATERVVILGASSGIGCTLAHQYARLGVRGICVVGRRVDKVAEVVQECEVEVGKSKEGKGAKTEILGVAGDFADPGDMVEVRRRVEEAWGGLDTLIVAAGVSALRPPMAVAGAPNSASGSVGKDAIQHVVEATSSAMRGNYVGPLVAAVTFIPLLQHTSPRPALLLLNSPAPTRAIYASTKAASLHLYQSIAIEHPKIAVSLVMPSTVEGDFRRGAVDAAIFGASSVDGADGMSAVREADPNKYGFKREVVAQRCVDAIERGEKNVFMPWAVGLGHLLYWVWPAFVERRASVKYNFRAS